jgi:siroheme synthase
MTTGKVYLVGAGPGDPGLMTVRGLQLLRAARVVVYDQLVNPGAAREEAPVEAERIFVGKEASAGSIASPRATSTKCSSIMRSKATVVRLKGGVRSRLFGRGGEEAEVLADAGVPFEIVPGVSSAAVAVPAYAGIPLTHRNFASSFAVVTGHEAIKSKSAVQWAKLATAVDVCRRSLPNSLNMAERRALPAAVVRQGTTAEQETVVGTLADIVEKSAGLKSPGGDCGRRWDFAAPISWTGLLPQRGDGATQTQRSERISGAAPRLILRLKMESQVTSESTVKTTAYRVSFGGASRVAGKPQTERHVLIHLQA